MPPAASPRAPVRSAPVRPPQACTHCARESAPPAPALLRLPDAGITGQQRHAARTGPTQATGEPISLDRPTKAARSGNARTGKVWPRTNCHGLPQAHGAHGVEMAGLLPRSTSQSTSPDRSWTD